MSDRAHNSKLELRKWCPNSSNVTLLSSFWQNRGWAFIGGMGNSREKKRQRKERNAQLRASLDAIATAAQDDQDEAASENDDSEAAVLDLAASKPTQVDSDNEEVDVKVTPSATEQVQENSRKRPRRAKMTWSELKQKIIESFDLPLAERLCALAAEHDGHAVDPLFTVWLKGIRGSVPVPDHWRQMAQFLSKQTDRESCAEVVPPEVEATDVQLIRQTKKKGPVNQLLFVTCFLTGSPLLRKRFGCHLTRHGEVFRQGQWLPPKAYSPGVLSDKLRQALGISDVAPPPWLRSMQAAKKLPPAYGSLQLPGLNMPIPKGGQWGTAEEQWGEPVRKDNGALMFPHIMDDAKDVAARAPVYWGDVPPLAAAAAEGKTAAAAQRQPLAAPEQPAHPVLQPPVYTGPPIIAPAFYAGATQLPMRPQAPESFYQGEYVRAAADGAPGLLVAGSKLVPKMPAAKPSAPAPLAAKTAHPSNPTKF